MMTDPSTTRDPLPADNSANDQNSSSNHQSDSDEPQSPVPAPKKNDSGWCEKCPIRKYHVSLQTHRRRVHQQRTTVTYNHPETVKVSVSRAEDSKFHCLRCTFSSPTPQGLDRHTQKCVADAGDAAVPDDPDLIAPAGISARADPDLIGRTDLFIPRHPSPLVLDPDPIPPLRPSQLNPHEGHLDLDGAPPADLATWTHRQPDTDSVIFHPTFNLPSLDIIINVRYHILICLYCACAIDPQTMETHVRGHFKAIPIPPGIARQLTDEFGLLPLSQAAVPTEPVAPIFGLSVTDEPYHFCGRCYRGYKTRETLRSHQDNAARCPRAAAEKNTSVTGHAQTFNGGPHKQFFRVDLLLLPPLVPVNNTDNLLHIFRATHPGPFDYSELPCAAPEREHSSQILLQREHWLDHIAQYTGAELVESCRISTTADGDLHTLSKPVVGYIARIQGEIKKQAGFGLQKRLADVGITDNSVSTFNTVSAETCDNYGRFLWRLVFNLLRQLRGEGGAYTYPLTDYQSSRLTELNSIIGYDIPTPDLELIVHHAIHSLFAHLKTDNRLDKYFSSVSCFAVITSFTESLQLLQGPTMTSNFMKLIYSNRSAQMLEIRHILDKDSTLSFNDAYEQVKIYLQDRQETPMAYLFNLHSLVKLIRSDDAVTKSGNWIDEEGTKLSYDSRVIHVRKFLDVYLYFRDNYTKILDDDIFLGFQPPPFVSDADLVVDSMVDDLENRAPGHCFLDNLQNPSSKWGNLFITWLLS
ncbi:hypothetical protein B0H12DRAFT_1240166, partial [Mycena haematopus]